MKTGIRISSLVLMVEVWRQTARVAATGLTAETAVALAESSAGRIVLHLLCARRDHRIQWHWRGVLREFARV